MTIVVWIWPLLGKIHAPYIAHMQSKACKAFLICISIVKWAKSQKGKCFFTVTPNKYCQTLKETAVYLHHRMVQVSRQLLKWIPPPRSQSLHVLSAVLFLVGLTSCNSISIWKDSGFQWSCCYLWRDTSCRRKSCWDSSHIWQSKDPVYSKQLLFVVFSFCAVFMLISTQAVLSNKRKLIP